MTFLNLKKGKKSENLDSCLIKYTARCAFSQEFFFIILNKHHVFKAVTFQFIMFEILQIHDGLSVVLGWMFPKLWDGCSLSLLVKCELY